MSKLKVNSVVYIPELRQKGVILDAKFKGLKQVQLDDGEIEQIADELIVLWKSLSWLVRVIINLFGKKRKNGQQP